MSVALYAVPVALLLGVLTGVVAHTRGESFGWWLLAGTVWAGIALPVLLWVRDGVWRPARDATVMGAVGVGNAAVIVGGWELLA